MADIWYLLHFDWVSLLFISSLDFSFITHAEKCVGDLKMIPGIRLVRQSLFAKTVLNWIEYVLDLGTFLLSTLALILVDLKPVWEWTKRKAC